uniref:Phospholipid phosphatase related 2 n=1 Tax=Aquila chrysaetos chrysaetos TaxID=223781 RepID=A0A663FGB9_AQUCH
PPSPPRPWIWGGGGGSQRVSPPPQLGILGGTAALAYQLEFTDAFPVHDGGFFCRDPAYGRPYPGPPGRQPRPPRPRLRPRYRRPRPHRVVFSFGLLATAIFANAGQVVTGAPAPHFLAVCRPNYSALGCAPPRRTPPFRPPRGDPLRRGPPLGGGRSKGLPLQGGCAGGLRRGLCWAIRDAGLAGGGGSRLAKPAAVLGFAAPPFPAGGPAGGRAPQPLG